MEKNTIHLQGNGDIVIRDAQRGTMTINSNDAGDSVQKLRLLSDTQIAVIKQLADEPTNKINDVFKSLLNGIVSQKNIVAGNISNVHTVTIGDTVHYHYHGEQQLLPKALTVKMPRTAADKIVGREAELADLRRRLFDNKQVVLVNGLGGIGKTTLAQVYIDSYWDQYHHIAWISQVSDDLFSDFITAEGLLDSLNIRGDGRDTKELFCTIMTSLNKISDQPNLLIIDNANGALSQWYDYLPGQPLWHILVTSRERIAKFDLKELDFLSESEATDLFLRHYTRGNISEKEIQELVATVDRHTLTIEILAKTAQLQRVEMDTLKHAINDDLKAGVYIDHKGDKIERVTSYLCSIFSMAKLTEDEIWLLKQFVCLPAEFQRYELLKALIQPEEYQKEDRYSETMETLIEKGWLLHNPATDSYKMHQIIKDVVKKQQTLSLDDVAALIDSVTKKLSIDQTKDNPVDKFPWIPYGTALLDCFTDSADAAIAVLQNNLATVLKDLGDYAGAKTLLEKALRSDENNFGADHPTTAVRYSNLATVLQALGDYAGALELSAKALQVFKKVLPPGHPYIKIVSDNYQSIQQQINKSERSAK